MDKADSTVDSINDYQTSTYGSQNLLWYDSLRIHVSHVARACWSSERQWPPNICYTSFSQILGRMVLCSNSCYGLCENHIHFRGQRIERREPPDKSTLWTGPYGALLLNKTYQTVPKLELDCLKTDLHIWNYLVYYIFLQHLIHLNVDR